MTTQDEDAKEKRKRQLRESQQRRREKLASGNRHQINIYLPLATIKRLDEECEKLGIDRHDFFDDLLKKIFRA